jgi:membrane fusion protein (multidrug efflux system)
MCSTVISRGASFALIALLVACAPATPAPSQSAPSVLPAVGVIQAARRPVTESYDFMGRVQAVGRVNLVARVNAFLETQLFTEGAEVEKGELLYGLEQPPYQADLAAKQAAVAQAEAQLTNSDTQLRRAQELLKSQTGTEALRDNALATQRSASAQLRSAQAAEQASQINIGYTEIRAPISGRIGRTSATVGNVVGPNSGTLATIVSQDPMYVSFPVPMRTALELRARYADKGGFAAVAIKLRLPDGRMYGQTGTLNFADVSVGQDTDSLTFRGSIANPVLPASQVGGTRLRELADGEFVTAVVEASKPVEQLTLPREAVLSDQRGDFVYVVGAADKVERRTVQLGQSTAEIAVISQGLEQDERVILEGTQRVQPGMRVAPTPADTSTRAAEASPASRS